MAVNARIGLRHGLKAALTRPVAERPGVGPSPRSVGHEADPPLPVAVEEAVDLELPPILREACRGEGEEGVSRDPALRQHEIEGTVDGDRRSTRLNSSH